MKSIPVTESLLKKINEKIKLKKPKPQIKQKKQKKKKKPKNNSQKKLSDFLGKSKKKGIQDNYKRGIHCLNYLYSIFNFSLLV